MHEHGECIVIGFERVPLFITDHPILNRGVRERSEYRCDLLCSLSGVLQLKSSLNRHDQAGCTNLSIEDEPGVHLINEKLHGFFP